MKFTETFPLMFCLNLARRQDRRFRCAELFETFRLPVRRFPAVDARWLGAARGFESPGRYAHALGTRLMIRKAAMVKAPAVFIFEDDVTLNGDLHERLGEITLPEDWGMFYLGGMHLDRPEVVGRGLVRVKGALSTHAFGVRACYYLQVMRALRGDERRSDHVRPPADAILARLHGVIPTYAVYPSLAGQAENHSDLENGIYAPYSEDGQQRVWPEALPGLVAESLGGKAYGPAKALAERERGWFHDAPLPSGPWRQGRAEWKGVWPLPSPIQDGEKVAFLFSESGDLPQVWRGYVDMAGERASVYRLPTGVPGKLADLRAQLDLLERALEDPANAFFVTVPVDSDPVRSFGDLWHLLKLDGRSRFRWRLLGEPAESGASAHFPSDEGRPLRIPRDLWVVHERGLLLNREVATLVVEDDFTPWMGSGARLDACYYGTVLNVKGYPLGDLVANQMLFWDESSESKHVNVAAARWGSGCFFGGGVGLR